ncbi:unnamed protein product [Cercospora beticola]|nr:unnamed protein product [Cercospora beticola]
MVALKKIVDPSIPVEGCYIFDKLPGEMRNKIWELSFTNNDPVADLRNPSPPTKSLLLTCKKINSEARGPDAGSSTGHLHSKMNQSTRIWSPHGHKITDLTIILVGKENEKAFKCIKESIFLDASGGCEATIKLKSNVQAHWRGHTQCGIHGPRGLPSEVADAWLRKMHDKGETEASFYANDAPHSMARHVASMLRGVSVLEALSAFHRIEREAFQRAG